MQVQPALSGRILARLAELERNQAWLARKLDIDLSTVYRYLTNERPIPARRLTRIATILDLDAEELIELCHADESPETEPTAA